MTSKIQLGVGLIAAFVLGAIVVAYSSAQQSTSQEEMILSTSFTQAQEEDIRAVVKDYLMTNPEIIIEAVNEYSARERALAETRKIEGATENLARLLNPENGYVAGVAPDKAKVVVIEMFDYHCSFCKKALPLIKEITERDEDVRMVFRELPILKIESDLAAEYSLAARDQDKFMEFHFALMGASGVLNENRIESIAKDVGLDFAKLQKSRAQKSIATAISETHEIAQKMGTGGTPTFIIATLDGTYIDVLEGFRPQELVAKIEAAKKAAS